MPRYSWLDPNRKDRETIDSWKNLLRDHDQRASAVVQKRTYTQGSKEKVEDVQCAGQSTDTVWTEELASSTQLNCCHQLLAFSSRPEPLDLVPRVTSDNNIHEPPAEMVSRETIRLWKQKRRRTKHGFTHRQDDEAAASIGVAQQARGSGAQDDGHGFLQQQQVEPRDLEIAPSVIYTSPESPTSASDHEEVVALQEATESLRSKLEALQPEGTRPSDIAAKHFSERNVLAGEEGIENTTVEDADQEVLSQVVTSQRSILLWDEIRTLVEATVSSKTDIRAKAINAVSELGLDNLEDGVLHRLCANEIFLQEQEYGEEESAADGSRRGKNGGSTKRTKYELLSYQLSLSLYRILFYRKAQDLKSIPSRLFLDAILHAGKAHGRAIVDSILLPIIKDQPSFSKLTSDLVQKTMKEQASAVMIHFLSGVFDPAADSAKTSGLPLSNNQSAAIVDRLPVLFLSEIHLATVQTIVGYANVPCPLPSRLWTRFNTALDVLWEQIAALIASVSSSSPSSSSVLASVQNEPTGTLLKLYCPAKLWEALSKADRSLRNPPGDLEDPLRLSNSKLVQLLMTWTIRQGPVCSDVDSLQRLRHFCVSRLDVKLGKGLVVKLDTFIKKRDTR